MPGHEHKQENANRYENRDASTHTVPSYGNGGLARIHLLPGMAPLAQVLSQKRNIFVGSPPFVLGRVGFHGILSRFALFTLLLRFLVSTRLILAVSFRQLITGLDIRYLILFPVQSGVVAKAAFLFSLFIHSDTSLALSSFIGRTAEIRFSM